MTKHRIEVIKFYRQIQHPKLFPSDFLVVMVPTALISTTLPEWD